MLKFTLSVIQILIGIYWAGDAARQNPKIDAFVAQLEGGYGAFNRQLQDVKIRDGLAVLRKLYGWLAIAATVMFFVAVRLAGPKTAFGTIWSAAFCMTVFGWFSIKWCMDHKKTVFEQGPHVALLVFSPFLMAAFDVLMGTHLMQILTEPLNRTPGPWSWSIPRSTHPMITGAILSAVTAGVFAVYYALIWVFAAPVAFCSAVLIGLPVALARFIHVIAPQKAFFGLTVVIFSSASLWLLWL